MDRRILITGGAGFIGANFVRHLMGRHPRDELLVLDALTYAGGMDNFSEQIRQDPRFAFYHGDVRNTALVQDLVGQVDTVVHFAAETHVARSIYNDRVFFETDVLGTQSVASAVQKNRQRIERFIHISTSEVYGTALTKPMNEDHPLNPGSPYAAAKAGADRLVYSYWHTYGIPAVILRPFNQFGPHQHLEKVIPRFVTSALLDEPLTIHGSGEARRDWLFVEDTCERIEKALSAPPEKVIGDVFNLGAGEDRDILSIAHLVLELLQKPRSLIRFIPDRPGQVQHHLSDTSKAAGTLGLSPGRPFEAALEQTVRWYKDHEPWWRKRLEMRRVPITTSEGAIEYY